MSESGGEKRFSATPSRIAKAKREGEIARSSELSANAAFAAAFLATIVVVTPLGGAVRRALEEAARGQSAVGEVFAVVMLAIVPLTGAAFVAAGVGLAQSGGLRFIMPTLQFTRCNPVAGLKRVISHETMTQTLRGFIAFAVAIAAIVPSLRDLLPVSARSGPLPLAAVAWSSVVHVVFVTLAVGGAFALVEYAAARRTWLRKLRMSFEEMKADAKEHEGDPHARSRRRSLHRQFLRGSLARVKDASFVVVNPMHVAIALQYRPPEVPVPLVLVRAADEAALRVREHARALRIPVIEDVALARALHRDARFGAPIPHAHYVAVAEIVAALMRVRGLS